VTQAGQNRTLIMSPGDIARALAQARSALERGDFPRAAQIAENLGKAYPDQAEAWFILGMALSETGHAVHALGRIERAVALAPGNAEYLAQQARLLVLLRREDEARAAAEAASCAGSSDPLVLDTIGCVHARLGDHGAAVALFERAVAARPDNVAFRFNLAASLGFFGRVVEAEAQYEAMLARDSANGQAHYGIAGLRRQTSEANHLARIEAAIPKARGHDDLVRLHYAAAKEYEDIGEAEAAFAHLDTANRAHKARIGYSHERDAALATALEQAFARPDYFTGQGFSDAAPVFVTGLPRTGTTLVDRILDAHPQVTSLGELQAMPLAVKRLSQTASRLVLDAETIAAAGSLSPRAVGEAYVAQAGMQAGASAALREGSVLLDKFPLNFLYIGHITRALPNAKIVCLRRQPLDSVWSNYKHLFALNSPYYGWSYDLMDTARYYALFDRLMRFWRRQFPGRVLELSYEQLTADQEGQTRALLAHCALPWDDACLDFHERTGAVATPSAQQVRRPLNRDSVERWRAYAAHLDEVQIFLGEAGIALANQSLT
jgi:Flp pilus assembly protein TadD